MKLDHGSVVVTGGASGLGLATARRFAASGLHVTILDLPSSAGAERAREIGERVTCVHADVTDPDRVGEAMRAAAAHAPLRVVVHCAGRGGTVRVLDRDGNPSPLEAFESIVHLNLVGSFNVLSQAAAVMQHNEEDEGDRGLVVMTASVAAFEGQIGQMPYAASKAGVVGMTLVAARDLARRHIRVTTIAPGIFDTPILDRFGDDFKAGLYAPVPHPNRLGLPDEFAMLAEHLAMNPMINGETIRLDGAIRMQPK